MADTTINNFDASTQDAAAFGFEQPIKGDGYALTIDPANGKHRYDVWDGDFHVCSPTIGFKREWVKLIVSALGRHVKQADNAAALRKLTTFGQELLAYHG